MYEQHIGQSFTSKSLKLELLPGVELSGHYEVGVNYTIIDPSGNIHYHNEYWTTSAGTHKIEIIVGHDVRDISYRIMRMSTFNNGPDRSINIINCRIDQLILLNLAVKLIKS